MIHRTIKVQTKITSHPPNVETSISGVRFNDVDPVEEELNKYRTLPLFTKDENILHFWEKNSPLLPRVTMLARRIFSINASSCRSERNFSSAEFVFNSKEKRHQLSPENVDVTLFLHSNIDH